MLNKRLIHVGAMVLIVGATHAPSIAGTIRHDRNDQRYRNLAAASEYESVGRFDWTVPGSGNGLASGTLISNQWVLTAGHVVDNLAASSLEFTVGGQVYQAVESIVHPDWTGDIQGAGDLALVRLSQVVGSVTAANLYTGRDEVGSIATIVGFGQTGDGDSGSFLPAGDKRAGNNLIGGLGNIVGYSSSSLMADFDFPDPFATGKAVSLDLEYLAAPGDSGGGWFVEVAGMNYLAGVTSFGLAPDGFVDSSYGDIMGATRIGDYMDWISSIIAPPVAGDYDGDGNVDGADFLSWQRDFGSTTSLAADGNGDRIVNAADLTIWGNNYRNGINSSAIRAIPEPSSRLLMLLMLLSITCVHRSNRSKQN